jgi:D-inositol-3-phosphate glycosyltransferase
MNRRVQRVAMVSMHTSPADAPGIGDAGGMNVAILALAGGLASRGLEVDLITRAIRAPEEISLAEGITLRTLAAGPLTPLPKAGLAAVADEFGEAVATLVGRTTPRYDLIHSHYWLSGLATLPVALELGLPLVQSFHTLGAMKNRTLAPGDEPEPEARLRSEAFLCTQADAIVAGSSAEVASLIDDLRAPADRLWVIPPGVDVELFTPERAARSAALRQQLRLPPDRQLLVVAGRIQPLKDQELAIRAFALLRSAGNPAPLLVIAGRASDEAYQRQLEVTAIETGIATDVRFVGALDRETLADLFAAAALTLVPSHSETFGLVSLETAASGTPVVGFRGTGLVESVSDGESGILIDSREPEDWARVIAGLLADQPRLAKLAVSARGYAEGFTWATAAASLLAVYESLGRSQR